MPTFLGLFLFLSTFASAGAVAQTPYRLTVTRAGAPAPQAIDEIFAELNSADAPGGAALVKKAGQIVFQRGYGVTDLRARHKIDERTNFRLASLSKQFTAMAVMLLVHEGKLRYEERLTDIFPDFPEYGKAITISNLLNHTSGLRDYEDLMPKVDANSPVEQVQIHDAEVLELLEKQTTTKFPSGTHWDYSNSGYVVLGLVVAKVSGQSFDNFVRDRIFVPLKMTSSVVYVRGKSDIAHRAYGHSKGANGWQQSDQSPTSATLGDGGVYSSLADLRKWDDALERHTLLSEKDMEPAITPVVVPDNSVREPDGSPAEYGFGWFLNPYHQHRRMWHYGETMGFRANIQRFTKDGLTIIVLCNRGDIDPGGLGLKVANLYLVPGEHSTAKETKFSRRLFN
ncbi:MAG TPA: serine hydrolase domain-containing protein [Terriglobales bacterium]